MGCGYGHNYAISLASLKLMDCQGVSKTNLVNLIVFIYNDLVIKKDA
jgi:hypothetical protein